MTKRLLPAVDGGNTNNLFALYPAREALGQGRDTATTFDVIDEDGRYCGGVIATGINLSLEALHRAAAKLPRVAVERPARVIGSSTVTAMQSGVFWGYISLVEGVVARIKEEFGAEMKVIATGGL